MLVTTARSRVCLASNCFQIVSPAEVSQSFLFCSDSVPAMQLEAHAALPIVSMSIYKGTSESRVLADSVMIGDPVALVVNLAPQKIYGLLIKDCYVKDGVEMGGVQRLIDSRG